MSQSASGDILSDAQPYTFVLLQGCYEYLTDRLIEAGVETFCKEEFCLNLTPCANPGDSAQQVYLDYNGYYNGLVTVATPRLPDDMVLPLRIQMRQSIYPLGVPPVPPNSLTPNTAPFHDVPWVMDQISPSSQLGSAWRCQWREDKLFFPGFSQAMDVKIKYYPFLPQLTSATSAVLVAGSKEALGYLLAEKACEGRGSQFAASFHAKAEMAINRMIARSSHKKQRVNFRRKPFRARAHRRGVGF